jgi:hypothetical protein
MPPFSSAYVAGTLLCDDGGVVPARFAFMACVQLVQSRNVFDGRLIARVCLSEH